MNLLFENWRKHLNEQSGGDLEGQTIVLIGDSQMIGGRQPSNASVAHQISILRQQRNLTARELHNKERWARRHMGQYLEDGLRARGANVIRLARGGWGSKSWNRNLDSQGLEYLKNLNPDQVVVNLGQNDARRGSSYFDKNTTPLMQKLKSLNTNVTWFGPSHITSTNSDKRQDFERVNSNLSSRAESEGINYVSMLDWTSEDETLRDRNIDQFRYDAAHFRGDAAERWANAINRRISSPGGSSTNLNTTDTTVTPETQTLDFQASETPSTRSVGKFVHGFKKENMPDFDFDQFYNKLDNAGLTHLLGDRQKDYTYGNAHEAARKALASHEIENNTVVPAPQESVPAETNVQLKENRIRLRVRK